MSDRIAVAVVLLLLLVASLTPGCGQNQTAQTNTNSPVSQRVLPPGELVRKMKAIEPFFRPMAEPGPFDWLATHHEKGQTFEEYLNENPTIPSAQRRKIYIQSLGTFSKAQRRVVDLAGKYIEAFYGLPVVTLREKQIEEPLRLKDFRSGSRSGKRQIRTGYILDDVLAPSLPEDCAALIAFTDEDLYTDPTTNYVFGQASLENRIGVWSLFRLDDAADAATFLRRTLKIAVHETGHLFGFRHCTKYECVMSGTNYLGETDRRPIDACPECMAKICWMTTTDPAERFRRLAQFCRRNGLNAEAEEFDRKALAVE